MLLSDFLFLNAGNASTLNFVFLALMILIFWFFLIRPQSKKQKEQRNFMESLQKGDEVVTASGMLGRINKIEEAVITLEVGNKQYIRVTKNAISKEMTDAIYAVSDKDKK